VGATFPILTYWYYHLPNFILAALIWAGNVKVWHIFLLSFLTGSAQSFSGPAYISLLPLLVSVFAVASGRAKASALALPNPLQSPGFSPWGMSSSSWPFGSQS